MRCCVSQRPPICQIGSRYTGDGTLSIQVRTVLLGRLLQMICSDVSKEGPSQDLKLFIRLQVRRSVLHQLFAHDSEDLVHVSPTSVSLDSILETRTKICSSALVTLFSYPSIEPAVA